MHQRNSTFPESTTVKKDLTPPHLKQCSWLEFEEGTVLAVCENLSTELKRISKKASVKRVHDTRVALRRWDSVWWVLEHDGWCTKKYWQRVGKKLKKLRKVLGELRDWDVNLEMGDSLGVPDRIKDRWLEARRHTSNKVQSEVDGMDMEDIIKQLNKFLRRRPLELRQEIAQTDVLKLAESAYQHLEPFLQEREEAARQLERRARDPISLHALRVSVKEWRYFLTEFFGLTNIELVRAQQVLGKYNDNHRVLTLLRQDDQAAALAKDVIADIEEQSKQLMKEFSEFRKSLPYGLRPVVQSFPGR
jgi:CHAD domain-containing protein